MSGIDPVSNVLQGNDATDGKKKTQLEKQVEADAKKANERTAKDIELFKGLEIRKDLVDATKNDLTWQAVNNDLINGENYRASLGIGTNLDTSA